MNFAIQTERKIKRNRVVIVVRDNKRIACLLIDMTVTTDNNILIKEYNKLSNYKNLEIEFEKNVAT